jgi:hypothetical protein
MEAVQILVVRDHPVGEPEGRVELLARGIAGVFLPLAGAKLLDRAGISGPTARERPREPDLGARMDAEKKEAREGAQDLDLGRVPDRVHDRAGSEPVEDLPGQGAGTGLLPELIADPDEMLALRRGRGGTPRHGPRPTGSTRRSHDRRGSERPRPFPPRSGRSAR